MSDDDSPALRRLKQATAARKRAVTTEIGLALEAVDAGEHLTEVSAVMGYSRETIRARIKAERERRARAAS